MQASWASRGVGAIALLAQGNREKKPFAASILDAETSQKDTETFLNALRGDPQLAQIPVLRIVSTGKYIQFDGTQATLRKPLRQSELYSALERLIGKQPAEDKDLEAQVEYSSKESADSKSPAADKGLILVAEDNTVNQKIVLRMLGKLGYRADAAGNGNEAISALRRVPYDAVLMDCQMPEMDGFEATSRIRKAEESELRHTPIIAMTAHALKGDRERCLKSGMDDYIAKPVKLEALKEILDRWISISARSPQLTKETAMEFPNAPSGLDVEMLSSWRDLTEEGESDFLTEVIDIFLDSTPTIIEDLREASFRGDADAVQRLAHKLKGSSSNLGARSMAELCAALEDFANRGKPGDSKELLGQLEKEFTVVKNTLQKEWRIQAHSNA